MMSFITANWEYVLLALYVVEKVINAVDTSAVVLGSSDTTLTLNQTPSQARTVVATRTGFAGIGRGQAFSVDTLSRQPKDGSVLQITGDTETYFVISVTDFDADLATCKIGIDFSIEIYQWGSTSLCLTNTIIMCRQ